jgi:alkylhydroperoxidase family enzyme
VAAIEAGADDATFAAVDHYAESDLPEATKAALALTDAMIWTPDAIPAEVVADVRRLLSDAQAVELVLDVVRNAANKIAVALGADAPEVTEGVQLFVIDPDGNLEVV